MLDKIVPGQLYTYKQYADAACYANEHNKVIIGYNKESKEFLFEDPPVPELAPEEIQKQFTDAIQHHLDAFAQTRGYDGILSTASYATSTNAKFRAEGQYAVEARDATWAKAYELLAEVEAGTRPIPTSINDILAELPVLAWP